MSTIKKPKNGFFISNTDESEKSIGGYMTTAKDSKQLGTYREIFDGMRFDHSNSELIDTECIVVRFKTKNVDRLYIPRNKNNGGKLNDL